MKTKPIRVSVLRERKRIRPDEKLPVDLVDRERELILHHTFADLLTRRLRIEPRACEPAVYHFTWGRAG